MKKRLLACLLTAAMLVSLFPLPALALEPDSGGLCPHHTEHSFEVCGYVEAVEGQPCGHTHDGDCGFAEAVEGTPCDMDCAETDEDSQIVHAEGCAYTPAVEGAPCQHEHGPDCGYIPADPGQPCGYVCPICPVQALIDALPTAEELNGMSEDEQDEVYNAFQAACDAYEALTDKQKEEIARTEVFESLFLFFYSTVDTLATQTGVQYVDENGDLKTRSSATVVEGATGDITWRAGWYVVNRNVTIGGSSIVQGDVHLILADGYTLTANQGIYVVRNNNLTIYGQSNGSGQLIATGGTYSAGIGGGYMESAGNITINGGNITATGRQEEAAGIGGAYGSNCGEIIINGGTVKATGGTNAYDIGGGASHSADKIVIGNRANVTNGSGDPPKLSPVHGTNKDKWASNGTQHWHPCVISGCNNSDHQVEKADHTWTSKTDQSTGAVINECTVCGYINRHVINLNAWAFDDTHHWHPCGVSNCNVSDHRSEKVDHDLTSGTDQGTGATISKCDECGYINRHVINLNAWAFDDTHHWHPCGVNGCDKSNHQSEKENHNWTLKIESGTDIQIYECSVCGTIRGVAAYLDENGNQKVRENVIVVYGNTTTWNENAGWYMVNGDVEIDSRVTVKGDVHLILADECVLTINGGIQVQDNDKNIENGSPNSLTIYAQSSESNMGRLTANGNSWSAGIGGDFEGTGGTIIINGGTVSATGDRGAAGIGGGKWGKGGTITINGGTVDAHGGREGGVGGAGIGGSSSIGDGGNITINGGIITATGGGDGAGIGGGYSGSSGGAGGTITITGGTVNATGGKWGAGIGGDRSGDAGTFAATGNAFIVASSISDNDDKTNWSGVIFEENAGKVYGSSVILTTDAEIPSGKELTIEAGKTLTIDNGVTLTNEGTIINNGTLTINPTGKLVNNGTIINNSTNQGITGNGTIEGKGTLTGSGTIANTITNNMVSAPRITTQPKDIEVDALQSATFTVEATGNPAPYTYKWQVSEDNGGRWADIPGATGNSYTITSTSGSMNGWKYRCVVSNSEGDTTSDAATLTVNKLTPNVTPPTPKTLTYDGTAQELISMGNTNGGELQYSTNNADWSASIPEETNADEYTVWYKVVGDDDYADVAANSIKVTIAQKSIAGATITLGDSLTYTGHEQEQTVQSVKIDGLNATYTVSGNKQTDTGTYTLTVTGTGNFTGSQQASFTISAPREAKPNASIDYGAETLTGLTAGASYSITPAGSTAATVTASGSGTTAIQEGWFGKTLSIIKVARDGNYSDSEAQSLTIPARPNAPTTPLKLTKTANSITITSSYSGCEFSVGGASWNDTGVFTGLTAGTAHTVQVRVKATANGFKSDSMTRSVTTVAADGSTTVNPGESVESGGTTITNDGDKTTITDGNTTTIVTPPSGGGSVDVGTDGGVTVPGGSTVQTGDNGPEITVGPGNGGTVGGDGGITVPDGGNVQIGKDPATTITPPNGGEVKPKEDGTVEVPGGSIVKPGNGGPEITVGPGNSGTVDGDGGVTVEGGGKVTVKGDPDTTITLPSGGGTVKPNPDGTIPLPGGTVVTPTGKDPITVPDGGGTVNPGTGEVTLNVHTVTFDSQGGSVVNPIKVTHGKTAAQPGNPTRSGYTFGGWYKESGCTNAWNFATDTVTGDITLYAKWTQNSGGGGGWYNPPSVTTYPVTTPATFPHGKLAISPIRAERNATVTITVTPEDGYRLGVLNVTSGGKSIPLTEKGSNKYTFTMPAGAVKVEATFVPAETPGTPWVNPFSDVSEGDWYYEAVRFVQERGLMNGYSDGRFGPNDTLSRAQLAQILFNKEGRPGVNYLLDFSDVVGEAWYTEAIRWATSQGIVGGYGNGTFGPNDPITREQLAVMLWRYSGSPAATHKELHFADTDETSGFALEALRWAVENGILNGYGDGQLGPQGQATRAQVAQMLKNFIENQEENT